MNDLDYYSDLIDSRDIAAHIQYLESEDELDTEQTAELAMLIGVREEIGSEFEYGVTLIDDRYFTQYAQELAEDIGAISGEEQWPLSFIDWERAAEQLQWDYSIVQLNGRDYWFNH